jgi:hypothetical protein
MKRVNLFTLVIMTTMIWGILFQSSISAQEIKKTKKTEEIILITEDGDIEKDDLKTISLTVFDDDSVKQIKYIISDKIDCKEIIEEELIFEKGSWTAISPEGGEKKLIIKYCLDSIDNSGSLSKIIQKEIKTLDIMSLVEGDSCLNILLKCDDDGKNIIEKIKIEMDKDCNEKTFHIYSSDEGEIKLDGDYKIIIYKDEDDCKSRVKVLVNDEEAEKVVKDSEKEEKKKDKKKRKKTD